MGKVSLLSTYTDKKQALAEPQTPEKLRQWEEAAQPSQLPGMWGAVSGNLAGKPQEAMLPEHRWCHTGRTWAAVRGFRASQHSDGGQSQTVLNSDCFHEHRQFYKFF